MAPGPEPHRLCGRRCEWSRRVLRGQEEGPTFGSILTHSRPDAVRQPPRGGKRTPHFSLRPLSLRQCGPPPAYPDLVLVRRGRPSLAPVPPLVGGRFWGSPAPAACTRFLPAGLNSYPGPDCTQSPAAPRAPPLQPPSLPSPPLPSSVSPAGPSVSFSLPPASPRTPRPGWVPQSSPWGGSTSASRLVRTPVLRGLLPSPLFAGFSERHFLSIQMKGLHFLNKNEGFRV